MQPNDLGQISDDLTYISNIYCDKEFLLSEEPNENVNTSILIQCPEIPIKIKDQTIFALIDSGANVNCLSQEWFYTNKMSIGKYEELPVNNVHIKTALGSKSRRIQHLILLQVEILQQKCNLQFIVIPNLIKPVILRMEFMKQFQVVINVPDDQIHMVINEQKLSLKTNREDKIGVVCQLTFHENNTEDIIEHANNSINNFASEELITNTLEQNPRLNQQQKEDLRKLLLKYQHIFSDSPGTCYKYQH